MNGCSATGDSTRGEKMKGLRMKGARIRGDKITGLNIQGLRMKGPRIAGLKTIGDKITGERRTGCDRAPDASINGDSRKGEREIPKRFCLRCNSSFCKPNFSDFANFFSSLSSDFCIPSF